MSNPSEFMSIENLKQHHDPFADADDGPVVSDKKKHSQVHIRIQQRNGRKSICTVSGLPSKFDHKKILKTVKKLFACNGSIVEDEEVGIVIQLQGDQRKEMYEFLINEKEGLGLPQASITVHGA